MIWTTTTGIRGNLRGPRRPKKYKKSKKEKEEKGKGKEEKGKGGNKKSKGKVGTHRVRQRERGKWKEKENICSDFFGIRNKRGGERERRGKIKRKEERERVRNQEVERGRKGLKLKKNQQKTFQKFLQHQRFVQAVQRFINLYLILSIQYYQIDSWRRQY